MSINVIVWFFVYPLIAFVTGIYLVGYSRKFTARVERRIGPPWQPFYDIVKLMAKKTNTSHGLMHDFSMIMLLGGTLLTLYFIPVPGFHYFSQFGDTLVILYVIMIPSLGMALGVGETANPNASIGIARALMMMAGYEVAFSMAFIGLGMAYNTTSMFEIIKIQQAGGLATWGLIRHPFLGLAALFALQGMMGEKPFETFIAPAEIATGPMVEMGGKYLGMMFIQHMFAVFIELMIYINLFLGGATNWFELLIKLFTLFTLVISVNVVFGRFKTDDAVKFMWKWPVGLAIIGILIVLF